MRRCLRHARSLSSPHRCLSSTSADLYAAGVSGYLRVWGDPVGLLSASAEGGSPLAHATCALVSLSGWGGELDLGLLRASLRGARAAGASAGASTQALSVAADAWACGRLRFAAAVLEALAVASPGDLLLARLLQDAYGQLGAARAARGAALRLLPGWEPGVAGYASAAACAAGALAEAGELERAEELAMRALDADPAHGGALHAALHVYEASARLNEADRLLRETREGWQGGAARGGRGASAGAALARHLAAHWAAMAAEEARPGVAVARFDAARAEAPGEARAGGRPLSAAVDDALTLWRLELSGRGGGSGEGGGGSGQRGGRRWLREAPAEGSAGGAAARGGSRWEEAAERLLALASARTEAEAEAEAQAQAAAARAAAAGVAEAAGAPARAAAEAAAAAAASEAAFCAPFVAPREALALAAALGCARPGRLSGARAAAGAAAAGARDRRAREAAAAPPAPILALPGRLPAGVRAALFARALTRGPLQREAPAPAPAPLALSPLELHLLGTRDDDEAAALAGEAAAAGIRALAEAPAPEDGAAEAPDPGEAAEPAAGGASRDAALQGAPAAAASALSAAQALARALPHAARLGGGAPLAELLHASLAAAASEAGLRDLAVALCAETAAARFASARAWHALGQACSAAGDARGGVAARDRAYMLGLDANSGA